MSVGVVAFGHAGLLTPLPDNFIVLNSCWSLFVLETGLEVSLGFYSVVHFA
jgi:hypothetical protein